MKKSILIIAAGLSIYSLSSCNAGKDDSTTTIGTDSSMMTTTTTSPTGDPSMAKPDSVANPSMSTTASMDTMMGKPDPSKKGRKGKVTMSMDAPKPTGSEDAIDNEGYYTNVYPAYPGGTNALVNYFEKNIQYPQEAADNGVEGTVNISFTVDEKGKVGAAKIMNPKIGYGVEEEAMRVFNKMPLWKAGSLKGKNVKTRYTLPVRFQLEG